MGNIDRRLFSNYLIKACVYISYSAFGSSAAVGSSIKYSSSQQSRINAGLNMMYNCTLCFPII